MKYLSPVTSKILLIDKYLFGEFFRMYIGTLLMLTFILIISVFTDNMKTFVASKQPPYHIALFIAYSIPRMVVMVTPSALMFSVCFIVGQFSANKELVSIMAAGVSFSRIIAPIFIFSVLLWIFMLFLGELVVRPFNKLAAYEHSIIEKGIGTKRDLVYQLNIKGKEGFYYIYWYDDTKKSVRGGFNYIKIKTNNLPEYVISAQNAAYDGAKHEWKLEKVEEILFDESMQLKSVHKFGEKTYTFPENADYFAKPVRTLEEMNFFELGEEIVIRRGKGIPYADLEVERHSIFATPIMSIIVVVIGSIAGTLVKKTAGVMSFGITIGITLLYYIFFQVFRSFGANGSMPAWISIWITPASFFFVSFYFYRRFNL